MNNILKNNIGYSGIVKISIMKGKDIVRNITHHNAGTAWLFKLLSRVLCGADESNNMPKYLDLGSINNSNNFESALANRCPLIGKSVENQDFNVEKTLYNSSYASIFTATISSLQVINESVVIDNLRLYSSKDGGDENLLAEVRLYNENKFEIGYQDNYNYLIEWIMTFENSLIKQER